MNFSPRNLRPGSWLRAPASRLRSSNRALQTMHAAMPDPSPSLTALQDAVRRGRETPSPGSVPACRPATALSSPPPALRAAPSFRSTTASPSTPAVLQGLDVEELEYLTEQPSEESTSSQAWVPLRIVKPPPTQSNAPTRHPALIFIHCTGSDKDSQAQRQAAAAKRGYLSAAIDTRYHGARVDPSLPYQQSLVEAWRSGGAQRPFLLDVVWDVCRLVDVLQARPDVDSERIGITGESLGGMIAWLAAAADPRIAAAAPIAGVQSFRYAVDTERFHDRVGSIPHVFEQASKDMKKGGKIDAEVVAAVWAVLLPGLLSDPLAHGYDAAQSLPLIAPRPLLVVTGEIDGKTHLEGVKEAVEAAATAYQAAGAPEGALRLYVEPGVGHEFTPNMLAEVDAFMDRWLLEGRS